MRSSGTTSGRNSLKGFLFPPAAARCGVRGAARGRRPRGRAAGGAAPRTRSSVCARATCRHRHPGPGVHRGPPRRPRLRGPPSRRVLRRRRTAASPAATCFCVSMGTGPEAESGFDLALTELLDDAGHRFLVEVGSEAGAEVLAALPHRAGEPDRRRAAAAAVATRRGDADAASSTPTGSRTCSTTTSSTRAGRRSPTAACRAGTARSCARPASAARRRTRPTWPATRPSACASGIPASRSTTPTSTAAASAARTKPLPPVDDAQAGELDRPVRDVGLRRLRALHHLVPGGDRHHRGSGGDPRTMQHDRGPARARTPRSASSRPSIASCSPAARANRTFQAGEYLLREGEPADTFFVLRSGDVALETFAPQRGAMTIETAARRRPPRLVVARAAVPNGVRRPRARAPSTRSRSTARACAASARPIPPSATTLLQAVRRGDRRAAAEHPRAAAGHLRQEAA